MDATVGEVGEIELISAVTARLPQGPGVLLGPGDDAAVLAVPDGRVVATTDLLTQDRHFRPDWSTGYQVGRKAAAANLADLAAMGARPVALLVGLAAPPSLPLRWALDLTDGLRDESASAGASVVGGDVVRADAVTIAITALGDLEGRDPVTRSGARAGDVLAVAGRLGWSAAGLALLSARSTPAEELAGSALVAAHRQPAPPYRAGIEAAEFGATSMIDISDGLVRDLGHVADASGVAIDVDPAGLDLTPLVAAGARCGIDPLDWVLAGGEDHALAATFPAADRVPAGWRVVGRVEAGSGLTVGGRKYTGSGGWSHFGGEESVR